MVWGTESPIGIKGLKDKRPNGDKKSNMDKMPNGQNGPMHWCVIL